MEQKNVLAFIIIIAVLVAVATYSDKVFGRDRSKLKAISFDYTI